MGKKYDLNMKNIISVALHHFDQTELNEGLECKEINLRQDELRLEDEEKEQQEEYNNDNQFDEEDLEEEENEPEEEQEVEEPDDFYFSALEGEKEQEEAEAFHEEYLQEIEKEREAFKKAYLDDALMELKKYNALNEECVKELAAETFTIDRNLVRKDFRSYTKPSFFSPSIRDETPSPEIIECLPIFRK